MKILWSIPVRGEGLGSTRGDLVRANALIKGLRNAGHEVAVLEYSREAGAQIAVSGYRRLVRRIFPNWVALILRDVGRRLHSRSFGRQLSQAIKEVRPDVLVETQVGYSESGSVAVRDSGIPLILDDCSPSIEEVAFGAGLPSLARSVLRNQVATAKLVVTITQAAKKALIQEGLPEEKFRIVSNGVDVSAYQQTDRVAMRERMGFSNQCALVFAGSFQSWHRLDLLVEAFGKMEPARNAIHLLLIGEGPGLSPALQQASQLGVTSYVSAIGAVPPESLPDYLCACDIGVLAGSNHYGQPMKLLEFAAAGLPSVAPDLPPVRETLENGVTGLLFAPDQLTALCDSLKRLVDDATLRTRIGEAARQSASVESWTEKARLFAELIHDSMIGAL